MERWSTFTGKEFFFEGDTTRGLKVYPAKDHRPTRTTVPIDRDTIQFVEQQIERHGYIKMGACRDKPPKGSLGEMLLNRKKNPQWLSYLLPLLKKQGKLEETKEGGAFYVRHIR